MSTKSAAWSLLLGFVFAVSAFFSAWNATGAAKWWVRYPIGVFSIFLLGFLLSLQEWIPTGDLAGLKRGTDYQLYLYIYSSAFWYTSMLFHGVARKNAQQSTDGNAL